MATQGSGAIGFGVIGAGVIGGTHAKAVMDADGATLVGIADLVPDRAKALAQQHHVKSYDSVAALLADPAIQVVNVCTPTGTHAEVGIQAAQAGKHVICEKPLDVTLEKADRLITTCRERKVKLAAIFQMRLHPLYKTVRETIASGRLGRVFYADVQLYWYRAPEYYAGGSPPGWRGTFKYDGGGASMNQGIHSIDLLQWIMGGVKSLNAHLGTVTHSIETEDLATVQVRFGGGAFGTMVFTTSAYPGLSHNFHFFGENGSICITDSAVVTWRIKGEREKEEEAEMKARFASGVTAAADPAVKGWNGHRVQVEDMVRAIREGRAPAITGEEARHALEIAVGIQQSGKSGKPVVFPLR
jgi:UDP-N-acetyl-2-amino-2-deoxyglucuronate dehydrogenase